ncbi:hypothetical protein [Gryllotalpicola protaetiae]|uniref:WXG100 family type VII secretion target n=1 Tax=Gryllotalpicola protaetiae TaxID=2419771 RepID=A0A387BGB5_9MICO|nr:hypothetical protein [Gryllotalpicola protaetiae]AYG03075.1 hypothetical protein D7I44_05725 [Gryllotalpicola protaetiae]
MGHDLQLDLQRLRALYDELSAVAREFEGADKLSDSLADATGHDDLGGKVRDFAHSWNDKREKMNGNVTALRDQVKAISDGFTQVDAGLARALQTSADAGPAAAPRVKS